LHRSVAGRLCVRQHGQLRPDVVDRRGSGRGRGAAVPAGARAAARTTRAPGSLIRGAPHFLAHRGRRGPGRRAGARVPGLYPARTAHQLGNRGRLVRLLKGEGMPVAADPNALITLDQVGRLPAAQTLVLTVNNRLARRLTLDLAAQLRRERQVSELPRVLPLAAWLAEAGGELAFAPGAELPAHRLDAFATQMVWADAIGAEEAGRVLLDTAQAAALAMDADTLMDEWRLRVPDGADTDEYRGFSRWRRRYRERLAAIDAEDANQGYARVLRALQRGGVAAPRHLVLAGFTDISPRFAALLDAFQQGGAALAWLGDTLGEAAAPLRHGADDRGAE